MLIAATLQVWLSKIGHMAGISLAVQSTHIRAGSGCWAPELEQSLWEPKPRHDKHEYELNICLGLADKWHVDVGVTTVSWHSASRAAECIFPAADTREAMVARYDNPKEDRVSVAKMISVCGQKWLHCLRAILESRIGLPPTARATQSQRAQRIGYAIVLCRHATTSQAG